VQGYDDSLTVEHVVKEDDGSYLVLATSADEARTALTVSADLATVEEAQDGPGFGPGRGGPGHFGGAEEVTGQELTDLTAAVAAYDASLTVERAFQGGDDGGYFVLATKGDEHVGLKVSADLKTVEEAEGPMGGRLGDRLDEAEVTGQELTDLTAAVTAYDADLTVERAFQRGDDGDYFVLATKGDEHVGLKVSADLKTVEEADGPGLGGPGGPGFRGGPGGPFGGEDQEQQQS
jgi:hypothetical protein